ncbi:MAG: hypothetical protein ACTSQI_13365 [Candidatus Helarchaeota archaeon]
MSLMTLDIDSFIGDGGLLIILTVATALFGFQTFVTYILWRRGDERYKLRFISLLLASIALFLSIITELQIMLKSGSPEIFQTGLVIFMLVIPVAAGLQIFLFIWETWLKKEEKA